GGRARQDRARAKRGCAPIIPLARFAQPWLRMMVIHPGEPSFMSVELYLAYVAATVVLLVIPGPTILLVVSYALSEGRRAALASTAGVILGDLTAMVLSLAGLGALMAA